ncbi:MAG: hypothetical protein ACI8RD_006976 [Bacillariaceae sp.]|jgi:hypothetical protein
MYTAVTIAIAIAMAMAMADNKITYLNIVFTF